MPAEERVNVAVIDDYAAVAETIAVYLKRMGCATSIFTDPVVFLKSLKESSFDIVITDIRMPGIDGITLLKKIKELAPDIEVIIISAHADKNAAIEALKHGAYDFFEKPVGETELLATIKRTLAYRELLQHKNELSRRLSMITAREAEQWGVRAIVGQSAAMGKMLDEVRLLQKSPRTSVLILGESGTGKELVARAIHFGSACAQAPFVPVNCSAIPDDLAESILFGHAKGAFTGATADCKGQFELADGGTLFLDEISDMPARLQTKLLRVLEDGIVMPVGKVKGVHIDVRVLSATNTNLNEKVSSGEFRSDLFFRLAAYTIRIPPLRERKDDIPLLVEHFTMKLSSEMGIPYHKPGGDVMEILKQYNYPGNIRELKNVIERNLIAGGGKGIVAKNIHFDSMSGMFPDAKSQAGMDVRDGLTDGQLDLKTAEENAIRRAMQSAENNVSSAARLLRISRPKLYRKLDSMKYFNKPDEH